MCSNKDCYFTICIPSYNRAYTIQRCLDSLVSQTYKNFEVVLVDDGSTDNTESVVSSYINMLQLKYIKKKNGGKHTALNAGIKAAGDTEFFMILDSDDWLEPDALEYFHDTWETLKNSNSEEYCGIMARCIDQNGKTIGRLFSQSPCKMDYVTFHFGGVSYGDCNECVKTSIIKQYSFPEPEQTKFVPEYYIFDQIGTKYPLYCVNRVTKDVEYSADGITQNVSEHVKKNWIGYFCAITCRLDRVVPYAKNRIPRKEVLLMWYNYWRYCYYDKDNFGERVSHVTLLGVVGKLLFLIKRFLVLLSIKENV